MGQIDRQVSNPGPSLSRLFVSFLRLGVTAFGGPAMVAYIRDLAVRKNHSVSPGPFADGTALVHLRKAKAGEHDLE